MPPSLEAFLTRWAASGDAEKIVENLVAVGVAVETREGQSGGRVWRPVRRGGEASVAMRWT